MWVKELETNKVDAVIIAYQMFVLYQKEVAAAADNLGYWELWQKKKKAFFIRKFYKMNQF